MMMMMIGLGQTVEPAMISGDLVFVKCVRCYLHSVMTGETTTDGGAVVSDWTLFFDY